MHECVRAFYMHVGVMCVHVHAHVHNLRATYNKTYSVPTYVRRYLQPFALPKNITYVGLNHCNPFTSHGLAYSAWLVIVVQWLKGVCICIDMCVCVDQVVL